MSNIIRFGVSLEEKLLRDFDDHSAKLGYSNRSEAIRDLIRTALVKSKWEAEDYVLGILTLVYDHHKNDLSRKLINVQHEFHELIITSLHFHMDHNNCLEILVLKGKTEKMSKLSNKLISTTGVKYGFFNPIPQGAEID